MGICTNKKIVQKENFDEGKTKLSKEVYAIDKRKDIEY